MCKKHVEPNTMDSSLSRGAGVGGIPSLPPGAAIYGQLVTFDQLSQLSHQPRSKQQQSICATAGGVKTAAGVVPTSPSPVVTTNVPMTTVVASSNSTSSLLNVMSASAYANLDPSYSLKNKSAAVSQQQQPMDISEPMELSSSSGSPSSGVLSQQQVGVGTMAMTNSLNISNTYSYPTFPYCNTATTASSGGGGGVGGPAVTSLSSCTSGATITSAAVSTCQAQAAGDTCMMMSGLPRRQQPPQRLLVRMSVKLIQTYETINEVSSAHSI